MLTTPESTVAPRSYLLHARDEAGWSVRIEHSNYYRIHHELGGIERLAHILAPVIAGCECPDIALVADSGFASTSGWHAVNKAVAALSMPTTVHVVPEGEASKSVNALIDLWQELRSAGASRRTLLVAVGGGMVCDLATMVAATYLRGIPYALIPTTVVAQADAAIGGKGGIDDSGTKNALGLFAHPAAVVIDPLLTGTLPMRHVRNGLAEILKVAIIDDPVLFEILAAVPSNPDPAWLDPVIASAVAAKLRLLAEDPYETRDLARLLNLGHCLGHPVEAASGYRLAHGEAVAVGLALATEIAWHNGVTDRATRDRILSALDRIGLPTHLDENLRAATWRNVADCRRARGGLLRLVLPIRPGKCCIREQELTGHEFDTAADTLGARIPATP